MNRLVKVGSSVLGSLGFLQLVLGVLLAAHSPARADSNPDDPTIPLDGSCQLTVRKCNPGSCTTAPRDCTSVSQCICTN
jgi:hypothetical protein